MKDLNSLSCTTYWRHDEICGLCSGNEIHLYTYRRVTSDSLLLKKRED